MVGGYFKGVAFKQSLKLRVEDRTHPATRELGTGWTVYDEIYEFKQFSRERAHVLLSVDSPRKDYPAAWCREFGRGRVFFTTLGCEIGIWQKEDFLKKHLLPAIQWAAGDAKWDFPKKTAYKLGVAKIDITPSEPIILAGYSDRKKPSEGVTQRLFARALAFEDGAGGRAMVVSIDAIGVTRALTDEVSGRLKIERFTLCATHSHTAPQLTGLLVKHTKVTPEQQAVIDRYTKWLADKIVEAGQAALKDLAPVKLSYGRTKATFAANRRGRKIAPFDHDVPVLRALTEDGKTKALLFSYACHCTAMSYHFGKYNLVCGDWAGFAQQYLEEAIPGAVAACVIGCGGDQDPKYPNGPGLELAQNCGKELCDAISSHRVYRPIAGPLDGTFERIELAYRREGSCPYPIQTLSFGADLTILFLGGEVVVDYSLRIKSEIDRVMVVAYANDVPGYIPSARVLKEGGYEGGGANIYAYGLPDRFAPSVEETIIKKVRELVPAQHLLPEEY
jgi:hypothetical protein